jgi:hypothetical protein
MNLPSKVEKRHLKSENVSLGRGFDPFKKTEAAQEFLLIQLWG